MLWSYVRRAGAESRSDESLVLRVDAAAGFVEFIGGAVQCIPLYITSDARCIRFSWDLQDLVHAGCVSAIDRNAARAFIWGRETYSHQTMFPAVVRLTERSVVRIRNGIVTIDLPTPARSLHPKKTRRGADVVGAYLELMAHTVASRCQAPVVCELSGGFDSSTTTLAATRAFGADVRSYGLVFDGSRGGEQQVRRRREVVAAGLLSDCAVTVRGRHFLRAWFDESRWTNPYDELYEELIIEAATLADVVDRGYTVLTGVGGDECFLPPVAPAIKLDDQCGSPELSLGMPKAVIPETALLAANTRAPMFLRLGMLPLNPYCEPEVVAFSERLPDEWKEGRRLQRAALRRAGVSQDALLRPYPENFESVLREELGEIADRLVENFRGLSVSQQIIDSDLWNWAFSDGFFRRPIADLSMSVRIAVLEVSLQGLVNIAGRINCV